MFNQEYLVLTSRRTRLGWSIPTLGSNLNLEMSFAFFFFFNSEAK